MGFVYFFASVITELSDKKELLHLGHEQVSGKCKYLAGWDIYMLQPGPL